MRYFKNYLVLLSFLVASSQLDASSTLIKSLRLEGDAEQIAEIETVVEISRNNLSSGVLARSNLSYKNQYK